MLAFAVIVNDSWPSPNLVVPPNSSIQLNCNLGNKSDATISFLFWKIDLASDHPDHDDQPLVFNGNDIKTLNANGLYDLTQPESSEQISLLINDTEKNNGTKIMCEYYLPLIDKGTELVTTILVLGKLSDILTSLIFHD